ncbi:MAG: biotin/lipoyl-binding protein, partial [Defluviitaleaceae bacterium]|nr:biotin/lipoyl-binding protein [Defluviitaleaceae bacterium]
GVWGRNFFFKKSFSPKVLPLLLTLIFASFTSCASPVIEASPGPELVEPAGLAAMADFTAVAEIGVVEQLVLRHGIVRVESEPIAFDAGGRVAAVYVVPGDEVRAGQILARLDTEQLEEEISRQEERIADLIRAAENSEVIFAYNAAVMQMDYADAIRAGATFEAIQAAENILIELERAELSHAQSAQQRELNIADEHRRLSELRERLADTRLHSPADGTITYFTGDYTVSVGEPFLFINISQDVFIEDVDAGLPFALRAAQRFQARVNGVLYDLEFIEMTLEEIAVAQQNDMPLRWRFEIVPRADGVLPPHGAYASIIYSELFSPDTLRVPSNAVTRTHLGHFVYVESGDFFERTSVRVGVVADAFTEILEGLEEGDVVLVR